MQSSSVGRRQGAEHAAFIAPSQGTAADLTKLAMIAVQRWPDKISLASSLIRQVHDELVLEVPDSELADLRETLPKLMAGVAQLAVPQLAKVGDGPNREGAH